MIPGNLPHWSQQLLEIGVETSQQLLEIGVETSQQLFNLSVNHVCLNSVSTLIRKPWTGPDTKPDITGHGRT